jgi:hypothetical protein
MPKLETELICIVFIFLRNSLLYATICSDRKDAMLAQSPETMGLLHIGCFYQHVVNKSIADVDLSKMPITKYGKREHKHTVRWLNSIVEGVEVVNTILLCESPAN